ncbi:MAG: hypothetical protein JSV86_00105 [Gemmatimonadota bacterium]|nr:MAG: hypothetical protein JSV86_00105 [Gemmatimonadota bacterium]
MLVELSLGKSRRLYGVVYPRDVWWTRIGRFLLNLSLSISRNPFRVFIHPTRAVDALIRRNGFQLLHYRATPVWQVALYGRRAA